MSCAYEWGSATSGFGERLDVSRAKRLYGESPRNDRASIHGAVYRVDERDLQEIGVELAELDAAQLQRIADFKSYLAVCVSKSSISEDVRRVTWQTWEHLNRVLNGTLEVPDACPGSSGELLLTWDKGSDHFEVEIDPTLAVSLFYLNGPQNISWESLTRADAPPDRRTQQVLGIFQLQGFPARAFTASTVP